MENKNNVPNFRVIAKELKDNASRYAATEAVNFFKDSFTNGGFTDAAFQKWQQTNNPMAGNRTMYRGGLLMGSIHKELVSPSKVIISSRAKYADIHNSGGVITITYKIKKYFWIMYATLGKAKKRSDGSIDWSSVIKTKKTEFCKRMALMPVGSKIKIPKRQFMGNSAALMKNFDTWFTNTVRTQVEPQFNNPTVTITVTDI